MLQNKRVATKAQPLHDSPVSRKKSSWRRPCQNPIAPGAACQRCGNFGCSKDDVEMCLLGRLVKPPGVSDETLEVEKYIT